MMIKFLNTKIKVYKFFQIIFGRETTVFALFAIIGSSLLFATLVLIFKLSMETSIVKIVLLTIIAADLAGGVIANFTKGTNNYYLGESLRKRYLFVLFHLIQPTILIWIFPDDLLKILIVSIVTIFSSLLILSIKNQVSQRFFAIFLLFLSLLLSNLLNYSDSLINLLMMLFSIKLILSFSVNWNKINKR